MWGGTACAGLGRWGRVDRGLRWPALGWAAVLIWKLARMDFLTIRGWAGRNSGAVGADDFAHIHFPIYFLNSLIFEKQDKNQMGFFRLAG